MGGKYMSMSNYREDELLIERKMSFTETKGLAI